MRFSKHFQSYLITGGFYIFFTLHLYQAIGQTYAQRDTLLVNRLLKNATDSIKIAPDKMLNEDSLALTISRHINYTSGIAEALNGMARLYMQLGNTKNSMKYAEEALKKCIDFNLIRIKAQVFTSMGIIYSGMGDYVKALDYFTSSFKIKEELHDTAGMAKGYGDIGTTLAIMKYPGEANKNFIHSIALYKKIKDSNGIGRVYSNIAANYMSQGKFDTGKIYLIKSMNLHDTLDNLYGQLGICYEETGKPDSALICYLKSLYSAKAKKNKYYEVIAYGNISHIYLDKDGFDSTEKYLKNFLNAAKDISSRLYTRSAEYELAKFYSKKGDFKNAFLYESEAYNDNDSLLTEEKVNAIAKMTVQFETKETEGKNIELQKENTLQEIRIQRKNILLYGVSGTLLLLLIIGFLLARQNKLRAQQQKMELERKQFMAQMNPHFIFNCLNSIQYFVVQNDIKNANKYLSDFASLMRLTLDNASQNKINLQKEIDYLENYLSLESMRFEHKFDYVIICKEGVDRNEMKIPPMVIQPLVENSIKHGFSKLNNKTGKLTITFYIQQENLFCEIDDNGIGREESYKLKLQLNNKYQSYGIELIEQLLALMNKKGKSEYSINFSDKTYNGVSLGTSVVIKFPVEV